jgi:prepilin-type N-terminal cleavage/methylation domain-containing protein
MTICGKTTSGQTIGIGWLRRTRRAFSLAELMIATGILGIGMIIVAMAFPVALDQSRVTVETTTSQAVFNEAVNSMSAAIVFCFKFVLGLAVIAGSDHFF